LVVGSFHQELWVGSEARSTLSEVSLLDALALTIEVELSSANIVIWAYPPADWHIVLLRSNWGCEGSCKLIDDCWETHFNVFRALETRVDQALCIVSQHRKINCARKWVSTCSQHVAI